MDRQLVYWLVGHHTRQIVWLPWVANGVVGTIQFLCLLTLIYLAYRWLCDFISPVCYQLFYAVLAIYFAVALKDSLKLVFGRFWADSFVCQNPSLLQNHQYGFNWMRGGVLYQSFPSGHSAVITAFAVVAGVIVPRLRIVWWLIALAVMGAQIALYYHFVSDVIAGATLGYIVATAIMGLSANRAQTL